jgi:hypothetical protein
MQNNQFALQNIAFSVRHRDSTLVKGVGTMEDWNLLFIYTDSERSGDQQERQMRYRTLLGLEDTRVEAILVSGIHLPVGKNLLEISAQWP